MFKGLRTKIESGQGQEGKRKSAATSTNNLAASRPHSVPNNNQTGLTESATSNRGDSEAESYNNDPLRSSLANVARQTTAAKSSNPLHDGNYRTEVRDESFTTEIRRGDETPETLREDITLLDGKLKTVIQERDEISDENNRLHLMIEKLREDLDNEKELNSSLQIKLTETESALKERTNLFDNLRTNFNTKKLPSKIIESVGPDGSISSGQQPKEVLRLFRDELIELQNQLSKMNRQMKIKQLNLNDLKKSLQREMIEHSKTQDELQKLQRQLEEQRQNKHKVTSDTDDCSTLQNGSSLSDIEANSKMNSSQKTCDKNQEHAGLQSLDDTEDVVVNSIHSTNPQMDSISCISKSSASIDDYDSNDRHQNNKEVNHEYLRNVLFRYMTSTDSETTQHLVKALSVLMNFTPEQVAAVKSAMASRNSWLRLK